MHFNDSLHELGSKKDRHDHIGEGFIGMDGFTFFMNDSRFYKVPKIIETPKSYKNDDSKDMDRINLDKLQNAGKALSF